MTACSLAQDGIPYLEFNLRNSGNAVEVVWQIEAGNTCQDVEIWRGTDSLDLQQVYVYPGICGDNDSIKSYSYIDRPSTAGIRYYYRIVIITDRSAIKSLVVYPNNSPEVFPNPASNKVWIIRDPNHDYNSYLIYDSSGREILRVVKPEISERIMLHDLSAGDYFIRYEKQAETHSGRLRITRR